YYNKKIKLTTNGNRILDWLNSGIAVDIVNLKVNVNATKESKAQSKFDKIKMIRRGPAYGILRLALDGYDGDWWGLHRGIAKYTSTRLNEIKTFQYAKKLSSLDLINYEWERLPDGDRTFKLSA